MRVACFISGGKDSMLALHKASEEHEISCIISVFSEQKDSYMFHTANISMVDAIARCLEIPLFKVFVSGIEEKEVEELTAQLSALDVDGIVTGAVKSSYQRKRFENVAKKIGAELMAPLWGMDERKLLEEVAEKFEAIIVKTSAYGLDETFLGRRIDRGLIDELEKLKERYGINISGEGGEYETLVLNAPLFKKRIKLLEYEITGDSMSSEIVVRNFAFEEKA